MELPQFSIKNIILDPLGKLYVKYPIGNILYKNKYNWKYTSDKDALYDLLDKNLGHALVLAKIQGKFTHPVLALAGDSVNDVVNKNMEYQKPYVIGHNDQVYHEVDPLGFVYGRYEITEPKAIRFFKDFKNSVKEAMLPLFNSIAMVFDAVKQSRDGIKEGKIIHNALVSEAAWGIDSKIKGICMGADGQCKSELAYAGNFECVVCPDVQKQVSGFLDLFYDYMNEENISPNRFNILFAGNSASMSEENNNNDKNRDQTNTQEQKPEQNNSKQEISKDALQVIGNEFRDQMKADIDAALKNLPTNPNKPAANDEKEKVEFIPKGELEPILKRIQDDFNAKLSGLEAKIKTQDETIETYKANEKATEVGKMLLEYKDFFRSKEGKIDIDKFNKTMEYWTKKTDDITKIKEDMQNSFEIARGYISNYTPETATIKEIESPSKKPQQEQETKPLTLTPEERRAKALEEVELVKEGIAQKATAGSESDEFDLYADTLVKNRRKLLNHEIESGNIPVVNNNQKVY